MILLYFILINNFRLVNFTNENEEVCNYFGGKNNGIDLCINFLFKLNELCEESHSQIQTLILALLINVSGMISKISESYHNQ